MYQNNSSFSLLSLYLQLNNRLFFLLNSIMVLSLDLIIIRNYKTMDLLGFEPESAFIVYVLQDPVWTYANFNVSISMFDFLLIFEFNNLIHENEDRFVLRRKLQGISDLYWLFHLSWEFWQQHIIQYSFF